MSAFFDFAFPSRRPIRTPARWVDTSLANQGPCMRVRIEEPAIFSWLIPNRIILPSDHAISLAPAGGGAAHQVSSHEMLITIRMSESYMGQIIRIQRGADMFDYALRIEVRFPIHPV